jgi:hypothetical protein
MRAVKKASTNTGSRAATAAKKFLLSNSYPRNFKNFFAASGVASGAARLAQPVKTDKPQMAKATNVKVRFLRVWHVTSYKGPPAHD